MKIFLYGVLQGNAVYFLMRIFIAQKDFLMNDLIFIVSIGFTLIAHILIEQKEKK